MAKMTSVCLFIAMAALQRWPLYQLDVKNAFLNGDLQEEIYLEQPPGFIAQGESFGLVCRFRKSLYGLKQSPRAWFGKFSSVVKEFGMTPSETDHQFFIVIRMLDVSIWLSMLMTLFLQVVITMAFLNLNNIFVTIFRPKILVNLDIFWGLR